MDKLTYTEYSETFVGSENNNIAVTVQIPESPDIPVHIIIQEPKLIKFTLQEFSDIEQMVYRALKEAGWKEEEDARGRVEQG